MYELLKEGLLDANVIFLVEGEEESGSVGFNEAVTKNSVRTILRLGHFVLIRTIRNSSKALT